MRNLFLLFVLSIGFNSLAIQNDTVIKYTDWKEALRIKEKVYDLEYGTDEKDASFQKQLLKFTNLHTLRVNSFNVDMDGLLLTAAQLPKLRKLVIHNDGNDSLKALKFLKQIISLKISYRFEALQSSVAELSQLEELEIYAHLSSIPEDISNLKKLKSLDLSYNNLTELPHFIGRLVSLNELYLNGNQLLSVSDSIQNLKLKILELGMAESLDSFPRVLLKIKSLEKLSITQKNLRELPTDLGRLENLRSLSMDVHLRMAWIKTFTTLSAMPKLRHLNLIQYSIYPEEIALLKNITHLEVTGNYSTKPGSSAYILGNICGMTHLESLVFNNYRDSLVSSQIRNLENLKTLEFKRSFLTRLPEEIGELHQLEKLYVDRGNNMLDGNKRIFKVPSTIKSLKRLQYLELKRLPIFDLPNEIGDLETLNYACFRNCQLHDLPTTLVKLKYLEVFDIRLNHISELPGGFGELQNLKYLILDANQFTKVDQEIFKLHNLEYLDLGSQKIEYLPRSIGQLNRLKVLGLQGTWISDLPSSLSKMEKLQEIYLSLYTIKKRKINSEIRNKIIWLY
jgi:Leucine-rich repeat (LRR) protein